MSDNFYNASGIQKVLTVNYAITRTANGGNYAVNNVAGTGSGRFTFVIPSNFISAISLDLIGSPSAGAAGSGKNIDLTSSYALVGQDVNTNSQSDVSSTYNLGTVSTFFNLNLLPLYSSLAANHICGILVDHNAIGGTVSYYAIRLVYNGSIAP